LYSYLNAIPFYERLGFECDSDFLVLRGRVTSYKAPVSLRKAEKEEIPEIIDFDETYFGVSREKLLSPILGNKRNSCHVYVEDGHIQGYAIAKPYGEAAELGPLVCKPKQSNVAINLLRTSLSNLTKFEVYLTIQERESAIIRTLSDSGFSGYFRVARMFLNPRTIKDCIYVAESLERG
ncbi:MAG TPA: hypothetical protein VJ574_01300, partial [Candidatus Bathyarchaeia archaeon]|nr:hypothetical protein [Candidatus Bathyarchaeia archaeon]